jgi:hypothetical protein
MSYAIGCLGAGTDHVARYRAVKAERADRVRRIKPPLRNQTREMTFAVISRPGTTRVKVIPVRQGHLHHVSKAYFYAERVEYVGKLRA